MCLSIVSMHVLSSLALMSKMVCVSGKTFIKYLVSWLKMGRIRLCFWWFDTKFLMTVLKSTTKMSCFRKSSDPIFILSVGLIRTVFNLLCSGMLLCCVSHRPKKKLFSTKTVQPWKPDSTKKLQCLPRRTDKLSTHLHSWKTAYH